MSELNELTKQLMETIGKTCGITINDYDSNYFDEGIDSYAFMELINELEQKYNIEFSNDDFANDDFFSINGLAAIIEEKRNV